MPATMRASFVENDLDGRGIEMAVHRMAQGGLDADHMLAALAVADMIIYDRVYFGMFSAAMMHRM